MSCTTEHKQITEHYVNSLNNESTRDIACDACAREANEADKIVLLDDMTVIKLHRYRRTKAHIKRQTNLFGWLGFRHKFHTERSKDTHVFKDKKKQIV